MPNGTYGGVRGRVVSPYSIALMCSCLGEGFCFSWGDLQKAHIIILAHFLDKENSYFFSVFFSHFFSHFFSLGYALKRIFVS